MGLPDLPDLPAAARRDHRRVTGGWLPLFLGALTVALGALGAWSGAAGLMLAAALVAFTAVGALQARSALAGGAGRLWAVGRGGLGLVAVLLFTGGVPGDPAAGPVAVLGGVVALIGLAGVARYWAGTVWDAWGLATLARASTWAVGAATAAVALRGRWAVEPSVDGVLAVLLGLAAAEALARGLWAVFRRGPAPTPRSALLALPFSAPDPVSSVFMVLDRGLGIDLRHTWALTWARRATFPLAVGLAAIAWAATALTVVEVHEQGVLERLGRPVADLEPGVHLHLPWPVDVAHRVDVRRVRERTIGYVGSKDGESLLWTRTHAAREHALLLGDGRDLVAVNARLQYRPASARAWLYTARNPEAGLEALAYQALTERTRGASLEGVLSENLADLADELEDRVRAEAAPLGVDVVAFTFDGLHPPVTVADQYQAVVSAQLDRVTLVTLAEAYKAGRLPAAEAEAATLIGDARSEAHTRTGRASGEAAAFTGLAAAHAVSPRAFELRRRLEALEATLPGRPFAVVDARFESAGGIVWVTE